ncbi:MAG TPA: hypothetical protein VJN44_13455 [Roseateles sp.]|nr:hypothetical protein [Roseateles sp.]
MLRPLVLILLIANALFFGWSRGWLDGVLGLRAGGDREPERLALQSNPERLTLLSSQAATALQSRSCLELGPLAGDEALRSAQAALERLGLTPADWAQQSSEQPGVWVVATIKLGTAEFRARKEETYKRLNLAFEPLQGLPEEQPSLVLSRHASEKAAEAALAGYEQRALKGLRVLALQAATRSHLLRLPRADGSLQAQLKAGQLAGVGVQACSTLPAGDAASAAASAASR